MVPQHLENLLLLSKLLLKIGNSFSIKIIYALNKSDKSNSTTGTAYFIKISAFFAKHYIKGELFMEYAKDRCKNTIGSQCEFCKKFLWKSPPFSSIPAPIPDKDKFLKFHYKDVFDTSLLQEDKTPHDVDDFLPRAQIKKQFASGILRADDPESIQAFSRQFVVEEEYVKEYLNHILCLSRVEEIRKKQRSRDKKAQQEKSYDQYNWKELASSKEMLSKLKVSELEKYLKKHQLSVFGLKEDKITRILAHVHMAEEDSSDSVKHGFTDSEEEDDIDYDTEEDEVVSFVGTDDEFCDPENVTTSTVSQVGRQSIPNTRYQLSDWLI